MTEVRTDIEVAAPPERVWALLTDFDRFDEWVTIHAGWPGPPPTDLSPGDRFGQCLRLEGRTFEVTWTVDRLETHERLDWSGEGPAGSSSSASYRLHRSGAGTRLEYVTSVDLPGGPIGKIAERVVEPRSDREAERSLQRLKRLAEA